FLTTISILSPLYDAFILDLWGCVHDGTHLYPGAKECMQELHKAGKKIVLLSNAPRRNHKVVAVLEKLGVTAELYDAVLSSGEAGYAALRAHCPFSTYFFIGPPRDADVLDGLPLKATLNIREAGFVLNVGFGSDDQTMENWHGKLAAAFVRGLPMLC